MIKLLKYIKPYSWQIWLSVILITAQCFADLYLPNIMSEIVDKGIARGDTALIWEKGLYMMIFTIISVALALIASYYSSRVSMAYGRDLRNIVFEHAESFSLHEFDTLKTSSLITRTTNDITQVQNVVLMSMRMIFSAPLMAVGGIIMALEKSKELSWIMVVAIPVLLISVVVVGTIGFPLFKTIQKKIDRINQVLREQLTGVRVIRAFDRQEHEAARFSVANEDLRQISLKVNVIMAFIMPFIMIVMNLTVLAVLWFGAKYIDLGTLAVGDMMAYMQYVMNVMFSFIMVGVMFIFIPRSAASAVRILEVLETKKEISDPVNPKKPVENKGLVEFQNVSFGYAGAEKPVLENISFTAKPGSVVAIIGGTGSGKSSLVNLIPRFYDITEGSIRIDGIDVREYAQAELRKKIAYVPQKAVLFTGTIMENIRFGDGNISEEDAKWAAEVSQSMDFVNEREEKFEAVISQGGVNVSGGQKQRLSIARAIARKSEIFIFDDSFSALDFKTDARLRAALKKEVKHATKIIVAQRAATIMDADMIIVLEEGKIAGIGTHKELFDSCEVYKEIVLSQVSKEALA